MIEMFGFLALPLGKIMQWLYNFLGNYGLTILVFTVLISILKFPLSIQQQKSTARTSAFQPMIQEIQKKWGNDKRRANEEMVKFQQENNLKMTAGCLPMAVNMIILFGIIAVIQAPLQYIVGVSKQEIKDSVAIVEQYDPNSKIGANAYTQESILIGEYSTHAEWFASGAQVTDKDGKTSQVSIAQETIDRVNKFNFDFLSLDLSVKPNLRLDKYLILPILSILTMFGSQFIIMKTSGQSAMAGKNSMLLMTVMMGVMFGWFAFTVPVGFSLYYTVSNVVMTLQQLILRKMYDPVKIKETIMREIEERKLEKKARKKITLKDEKGREITREVSETELAKIRLAKARELDMQRYAEEQTQETQEAIIDPNAG